MCCPHKFHTHENKFIITVDMHMIKYQPENDKVQSEMQDN